MMYTFRKMTSNDLELMVMYEKESRELEPDVFSDFDEESYRKKFLENQIEEAINNDVVLCIENDSIIGRIDIISEYSYMDFGSIGYIDWVYVLKPFRNKGIAKLLFLEAEKLFKENGVGEYYLFVASNEEAKYFYKSLNMDIKRVEKGYKKL